MSSIIRPHRPHWCLSVTLLVVFIPLTASAQLLPKIPQIQPFGIDGFRLMLQQRGLQATVDRVGTALNEKPEETVAVVLGDLKAVTEGGGIQTDGKGIQKQLERFVENGGNLLVASDLRGQGVRKAQICGTWVRELRSWLTRNEKQNAYHNFMDCPVVTSFDSDAEPKLFSKVERLVANRPSAIAGTDKSADVAWLPMRRSPPLMSVQRRGAGKMLFIADHSFFVNEMLVHADNAQFANNVTHWLADSDSRTRLVLISDGNVLPNWTFGESPPSIPLSSLLRAAKYGSLADLPLGDSLLPFLNESISRSQQENEFNAALKGAARALSRGRGLRLGVLIATLLIAISFVGWLISLRATPRRWLAFQDWHQPRRRIRSR